MASEYQIMAMINDLNRQVRDHEALSRQADNKAKTATTKQEIDKLQKEAKDHISKAEKLKEHIEDLKKRLEKQKQLESTQTQKWGKVGREAASISKEATLQQIKQINSQQKSH